MSWIKAHLTYANVGVTICLFLVLGGGTALASYVISSNRQIGPGTISGHKPPNGDHANIIRGSVTGGDVGTDSLTGTDIKESSLGSVPSADHATNSDQLGGRRATGYQRRVAGTCNGGAIRAINGAGAIDCTDQAVFPISADLSSGGPNSKATQLGPSNLGLLEACGGSFGEVRFSNFGSGGATLNWLFSQGGTSSTVNASGTSLAAPGQGTYFLPFDFTNRVEGQWIFADAEGVTTVNLHGFVAPGSPAFCEFKGTAEYAPNQ